MMSNISLISLCALMLVIHECVVPIQGLRQGLLKDVGQGQPQDVGQDQPKGIPKGILTFVSLLNGQYSNINEVNYLQSHGKGHVLDVINGTFMPVRVQALNSPVTLYAEESVNDQVFRMHVLAISEDDEGLIHIVPYNFTDVTQHKPRSFDISALQNLALSDFKAPPGNCEPLFKWVEKDVAIGPWPDCTRNDPSGGHPAYPVTISRHSFSFVQSNHFSKEKGSPVPYQLVKERSYPLLPEWTEGVDD